MKIEDLPGPALVRAYNELAAVRGVRTVERFADRKTGVVRVEASLRIVAEQYEVVVGTDGAATLTPRPKAGERASRVSPGLARLRATLGDEGAEALRQASAGDAEAALAAAAARPDAPPSLATPASGAEALAQSGRQSAASPPLSQRPRAGEVVVPPTVDKTPTPAPKPRGKSTGRPPLVVDGDVVRLRQAANPKRGSAAARYALYRDGMTFGQYAEAVGDRKQALRDVAWDSRQGWVEVVGGSRAGAK